MLRIILLISSVCSCYSNVISLEGFSEQKQVYLNKIWNKDLDNINYQLLVKVKFLRSFSFLSLFYSYINLHFRSNKMFAKLTGNCSGTEVSRNKNCWENMRPIYTISIYPIKRQDIFNIPWNYRLRGYTCNHFIQIRDKYFSF